MSYEASKMTLARPRRIDLMTRAARDPETGKVRGARLLDLGCGPDPVALMPAIGSRLDEFRAWDLEDGDAQVLDGMPSDYWDCVHASHLLEHVVDPVASLRRWVEVTRPGGHVVVVVPEEDMYERGIWPSRFNSDHKHSYTMCKVASWSPVSINVLDLCGDLADVAETVVVERIEDNFHPGLPLDLDQTQRPVPCAIEFVLRKRLTWGGGAA